MPNYKKTRYFNRDGNVRGHYMGMADRKKVVLVHGKLAVPPPDSSGIVIEGLRGRSCFVKGAFNFFKKMRRT